MGTIVKSNRAEYQRSDSGKHYVLPTPVGIYNHFFNRIKMAELKAMIFLGTILGLPLYGYTIWINWGTWRADILLGLSVIMAVVKIYFMIAKGLQDVKNRELSLKQKEHDINKKIEEDE